MNRFQYRNLENLFDFLLQKLRTVFLRVEHESYDELGANEPVSKKNGRSIKV